MAGGIFGGGTGAVATPFLIEDAHDLSAIRSKSGSHFYYKLTNDINLNVPPYNEGTGWTPIPYFRGVLSGDGYKISGLRVHSTGTPVGLFLQMDYAAMVTNTHFDDFYLEMVTDSAGSPVFTLLGYYYYAPYNNSYYPIRGCSFVGKTNLNAPNANMESRNEGLIARAIATTSSTTNIIFQDVYIDIENLGNTSISLYGTVQSTTTRLYVRPVRNIVKSKGKVTSHYHKYSNDFFNHEYAMYLIDEIGYDYTGFLESNASYNYAPTRKQSSEFNVISDAAFVNQSYDGRTTWYFPPNSHPRMADRGDERFLIEADGEIYTYNEGNLLTKVGTAPVTIGMFENYGIRYIESVPSTAWGQVRDSLNVEIHCQVKKLPKKTASKSTAILTYSEAIGSKIVLRCPIIFENHNNDILGITIPKEV